MLPRLHARLAVQGNERSENECHWMSKHLRTEGGMTFRSIMFGPLPFNLVFRCAARGQSPPAWRTRWPLAPARAQVFLSTTTCLARAT